MVSITIEAICNQALHMVGYKHSIGNIYEGSMASRAALSLWVQTRDTLLNELKPIWSYKDAPLVLLKSAPNIVNGTADYTGIPWNNTYPELPYLYEYQYPADCIQPLNIKSSPLQLPRWRPRFIPFRLNFDATSNARTILTDQPAAILVYVSQVTDPNDWQNDFTELMVATLAKKFEAELAEHMPQRGGQQQQQQGQQSGNSAS